VKRAGSALALLLILAVTARAQWAEWWERRVKPRFAPQVMPDRAFTVCRLMYDSVRWEAGGQGWRTDYPDAERNLMVRLSELTLTPVSVDGGKEPNHYVVRMTDEALFECPFAIASDVGTISFTPEEAAHLREYLLKGGFLWVDDFWGTEAWEHWQRQFASVLPPSEYPMVDVPLTDPMFRSLYTVEKVPQITSIQFWRRSGGATTSERGDDSREPHLRAIRDAAGRIMVVMTYNTDIADAWEREAEDRAFFDRFSPDGYAVGINVVLHAMTH
jgi:hypothetical protein